MPLHAFYAGYKQLDRRPDELVTALRLPPPQAGWVDHYRKVGTRRFQAISKTLLAARLKLDDAGNVEDVRLVLARVAPHTLRAVQTEDLLRGRPLTREAVSQAAEAVQDEIAPIGDVRSNARYRRRVTSNLIVDFLTPYAR